MKRYTDKPSNNTELLLNQVGIKNGNVVLRDFNTEIDVREYCRSRCAVCPAETGTEPLPTLDEMDDIMQCVTESGGNCEKYAEGIIDVCPVWLVWRLATCAAEWRVLGKAANE